MLKGLHLRFQAAIIYVFSPGVDVHCFDPSGAPLGRARVPFVVSNLCLGERQCSRPFLCGSHALYARSMSTGVASNVHERADTFGERCSASFAR